MPSTMQIQSISGIITQVRTTTGEIPPPLVGASVTVVGDQVFVFAGRLSSTRKMTNHMYVLDLHSMAWTRHIPPPDSDKPPKPRYFHSASVYGNSIVVFGGMGYSRHSADGLCVLDDVSLFDIDTMCWRRPEIKPSLFAPKPRYAHLSSIAEDKLIIIGGQDMDNSYLEEINILDLKAWEWVQVKPLDKHVGAYRSIAVATPPGTRLPAILRDSLGDEPFAEDVDGSSSKDQQQQYGSSSNNIVSHHRASLIRQYGQILQSPQEPSPIYMYTNYNFTDVKRELQLIFSPASATSSIEDCSRYMTGSVMPPGLRFPTGHALGHHLILAGTYLTPDTQAYTIWSLNLGTLTWGRIETGAIFSSGSWNKGCLHENSNKFLVFGNRSRSLLEDYNHRQVNFDHVAAVDLEAFGVYKLPKTTCSSLAQEMGLSLLNEPAVSDFTIITRENQTIAVNSALVCQRWPFFAELMKGNRETNDKESVMMDQQQQQEQEKGFDFRSVRRGGGGGGTIKSHSMVFPYPYSVVVALLQFIYTDNLLTAQQYQPHILSQLLLLADMYNLPRLKELTTHALHQMLNMSTAPLIFETAALSHQTSLQIRALKMMIAAKKMIQQQQQQLRQQATQQRYTGDSPTYSMPSPGLSPQRPTFDPSNSNNNNTVSPTLSAYRTRTPSLTNRSTIGPRSSISAQGMRSYSPPGTPGILPTIDSISELSTSREQQQQQQQPQTTSAKKTKKKKPFLEAFGSKLSMTFQ